MNHSLHADATPGQFLITGSANVVASKRVKHALPGRGRRISRAARLIAGEQVRMRGRLTLEG